MNMTHDMFPRGTCSEGPFIGMHSLEFFEMALVCGRNWIQIMTAQDLECRIQLNQDSSNPTQTNVWLLRN